MSNEDNLAKGKESIELEKKLGRKYGKEFIAEVRGLDKSGLENKILGMANHNQELITTKNLDIDLGIARDTYTKLGAPYRDQLTANKAKSRFIHLILKELDGDVVYEQSEPQNDSQIEISVN